MSQQSSQQGKYSSEYTPNFPDDDAIERVLEKYGDTVDKYRPGLSLSHKIEQAKLIAWNGPDLWKWKMEYHIQRALEAAWKKDKSAKNFLRLQKFSVTSGFSITQPAQKPDKEFFGGTVGAVRKGQGPTIYHGREEPDPKNKNEFKGKGTFGSPLLILKHGTDLTSTGFENAFVQDGNDWKAIECWNVGDETMGKLDLIQSLGTGPGSLSDWLSRNADRYLCSFWLDYGGSGGAIDPMTGQPAMWSDPEAYTIGIDCKKFRGFLAPENDYEVIDVGFAAFKVVAQGLTKVADAGVSAAAPPPDMIEHLKQGIDLYEIAEELGITEEMAKKLSEAIRRGFGDTEPEIVTLTFSPTAGAQALNCGKTHFKSNAHKKYGYGVKISTVASQILSAAKSASK